MRVHRTLIRCHKAALFATRDFWKQLLHHDVSFLQLTKAFSSIEGAALTPNGLRVLSASDADRVDWHAGNEVRAEKSYRMILERYPTSAKLLRTYARFLEGALQAFSTASCSWTARVLQHDDLTVGVLPQM
jgi:hypothetical protein